MTFAEQDDGSSSRTGVSGWFSKEEAPEHCFCAPVKCVCVRERREMVCRRGESCSQGHAVCWGVSDSLLAV